MLFVPAVAKQVYLRSLVQLEVPPWHLMYMHEDVLNLGTAYRRTFQALSG